MITISMNYNNSALPNGYLFVPTSSAQSLALSASVSGLSTGQTCTFAWSLSNSTVGGFSAPASPPSTPVTRATGSSVTLYTYLPGQTTITLTGTISDGSVLSQTVTLNVAADLLIMGPDGNYYYVSAQTWTRSPKMTGTTSNFEVVSSVESAVTNGSILAISPQSSLLTSTPTSTTAISCYVLNLQVLRPSNGLL